MHPVKRFFLKFMAVRSVVGRVARWVTYLIAFMLGLKFVGPFLTSAVYKSLLEQAAAIPLLGYLLDPEDWVLDQFIRNFAILLAVWTCALVAYCNFRDRVDELNEYLGYVSFLTRGVGTFLIALFMVFVGTGAYPVFALGEGPAGMQIVAIALFLFGLPGLFFSHYAQIGFKRSQLLDAVAPYAAVTFGLLTVAAMIYGAAADVIGLARFLLKHA